MRAFVAIFPPPEVREKALGTARRLIPNSRIRWSKPENVHLTLKFLGDVREETLGDLHAILEGVCARHAPFDVGLAGLGAFPSARRARILWTGVDRGSEQLRSLAADLDEALVSLSFEREERSYEPHLTLGRVRGRPVSLKLPGEANQDLRFQTRRVELTQSTLTDKGAVYKTVRVNVLEE